MIDKPNLFRCPYGRVYKQEPVDLVQHQLAFMCAVRTTPGGLRIITAKQYSYRYVEGENATDFDAVVRAARRYIWSYEPDQDQGAANTTGRLSAASRRDYINYVMKRCTGLPVRLEAVKNRLADLLKYALTPARCVHGDLTLENCIDTGNGIVFIDAGRPLLPCVELDLGKLAQCLNALRPDIQPRISDTLRIELQRPTVRAFELSHWIRLCVHPEKFREPEVIRTIALDRIKELTCCM